MSPPLGALASCRHHQAMRNPEPGETPVLPGRIAIPSSSDTTNHEPRTRNLEPRTKIACLPGGSA